MAIEKRQCKALSRQTGNPCRNKAVKGSDYCRFHGGGAVGNRGGGRPKGQPKTGGGKRRSVYSARLRPEELVHYEQLKAAFEEDLGGEEKLSASDRLLICRLATNAAKIAVAEEKEVPPETVLTRYRLELELLRELKTTRATRDSGSAMGTSPAEVLAAFLEQARRRGVLPRPVIALPAPETIDVEATVVGTEGSGDEDQTDE